MHYAKHHCHTIYGIIQKSPHPTTGVYTQTNLSSSSSPALHPRQHNTCTTALRISHSIQRQVRALRLLRGILCECIQSPFITQAVMSPPSVYYNMQRVTRSNFPSPLTPECVGIHWVMAVASGFSVYLYVRIPVSYSEALGCYD